MSDDAYSLGNEKPAVSLNGSDLDDMPEMIKYNEEFEAASSVSSTRPINWTQIERCARIILRDYVKHFQIAANYGIALLHLDKGINAVLDASVILHGIFTKFWDDALPPKKRKKGRFAAVDYWLEATVAYLDSYQKEDTPKSLIDKTIDAVSELDSAMAEIDEGLSPNLRILVNKLRQMPCVDDSAPVNESVQESEQQQPDAEENAVESKSAEPAAVPAKPEPATKPVESAPVLKSVDKPVVTGVADRVKISAGFLIEAADAILQNDLSAPLSYRYRRMGAWMQIMKAPPADNGMTMIPAPADEIKAAFEKLYVSGQYEALLKAAEGRQTSSPFWLDLSFYSATSLEKLGFADAASEVKEMTSWFIRRIPGIPQLHFDGGEPMCNADTIAWLASLSQNGEADTKKTDGVADRIKIAINDAASDSDSALAQVEAYANASSGLARLRYRAALAKIFASMGRDDLSTGVIAEVLKDVQANALGDWSSAETSEILGFAFDIYKQAGKIPEAQKVLTELALLNPTAAIAKTYTDE